MSGALVVGPFDPDVPRRQGPSPLTTRPSPANPFPHQQLTQTAPAALQERLFRRATSLPGVTVRDSCVSVPGARAFHLDEEMARGPEEVFQCAREFAHLHPPGDGSMHLTLSGLALLAGGLVLRWLVCRAIGAAGARDTLGALLASAALSHVVAVANLWALLGRQAPWQITDKFRRPGRGPAALRAVHTELADGGPASRCGCGVTAGVDEGGHDHRVHHDRRCGRHRSASACSKAAHSSSVRPSTAMSSSPGSGCARSSASFGGTTVRWLDSHEFSVARRSVDTGLVRQ